VVGEDVARRGGRFVLFASASCPHEVTAVTSTKESRVALAGWFHEEQQPFPAWLVA